MPTLPKDIIEKIKEFNKLFCYSYPGDSGLGGNDPQEPVDDWACYPEDVRKWLFTALQEAREEGKKEITEKIKKLRGTYLLPIDTETMLQELSTPEKTERKEE